MARHTRNREDGPRRESSIANIRWCRRKVLSTSHRGYGNSRHAWGEPPWDLRPHGRPAWTSKLPPNAEWCSRCCDRAIAVVRIKDTAKRLAAMRGANPQGTYNRTRPPRMDLDAAPLSTRHRLTVHTTSSGLLMGLHFAMSRPWWRNPLVRPTSGECQSRPTSSHAVPPMVLR